jgi:hypothetical protein
MSKYFITVKLGDLFVISVRLLQTNIVC